MQIALAHPKCKVIAIAGSADKCAKLKQMGCHAALNYKDADFQKQFRKVGLVDVYFDNGTCGVGCPTIPGRALMAVGGEILDLLLARMNPYGRIIACGAISAYS